MFRQRIYNESGHNGMSLSFESVDHLALLMARIGRVLSSQAELVGNSMSDLAYNTFGANGRNPDIIIANLINEVSRLSNEIEELKRIRQTTDEDEPTVIQQAKERIGLNGQY